MFGFGKSDDKKTKTSSNSNKSDTKSKSEGTTSVKESEEKPGFIKRAIQSTWKKTSDIACKGLFSAFKLGLVGVVVYGTERMIEDTYEKVSGNEIKWQFGFDEKHKYGFSVQHIDNPNIYVGENTNKVESVKSSNSQSSYVSTRGDELDSVLVSDEQSNESVTVEL